jgi:hypothetical protein
MRSAAGATFELLACRGVRSFGGLLNRRRGYERYISGSIDDRKRAVPELTNEGPAAERIIRRTPGGGGTRPAAV